MDRLGASALREVRARRIHAWLIVQKITWETSSASGDTTVGRRHHISLLGIDNPYS